MTDPVPSKDLVENLKNSARYSFIHAPQLTKQSLFWVAANEIERLQRELAEAEADCRAANVRVDQMAAEWIQHKAQINKLTVEHAWALGQLRATRESCEALITLSMMVGSEKIAENCDSVASYRKFVLQTIADLENRAGSPPVHADEIARREQLADRLSWPQPVREDLDKAADIVRSTLPPPADPLQTETRAATSRGARSTEDAGRSGPLCSECNNTRVVIVDGHENVCPDCCCWDCGVAPGEAHYSACEAVGRAAQPPRDG